MAMIHSGHMVVQKWVGATWATLAFLMVHIASKANLDAKNVG
jgi:hypothetical protein